MQKLCVRITACLALAAIIALGWMTEGLAEESAPPPAAKNTVRPAAKGSPSPANTSEEAAARFSKQLAAFQEQWTALSAEESQTLIKALSATKTAMDKGKIEDTKKTRDELGKGTIKAEWRKASVTCACPIGCGTAGLPSRGERPATFSTAGQASRATLVIAARPNEAAEFPLATSYHSV
jgi:ABC-type phosphate transport system substrate-binding protein